MSAYSPRVAGGGGVGETDAFGPNLKSSEIRNAAVLGSIGDRVIFYEELIEPLKARGHDELCEVLEEKIAGSRREAAASAR
jgi:hypothetical protein